MSKIQNLTVVNVNWQLMTGQAMGIDVLCLFVFGHFGADGCGW